jgi:hypothetical protein
VAENVGWTKHYLKGDAPERVLRLMKVSLLSSRTVPQLSDSRMGYLFVITHLISHIFSKTSIYFACASFPQLHLWFLVL